MDIVFYALLSQLIFFFLCSITSSHQMKKYEKYFNKTLKVCTRLEGEISLYSQYVATLETAVASIPKSSKLYKVSGTFNLSPFKLLYFCNLFMLLNLLC